MRLSHSTASFVRAYGGENHECLLDGHVRTFRIFSGVLRRCACANIKVAVISVGEGQNDGPGEFILKPEHYVPLLQMKPGGIHSGRRFRGQSCREDFARMRTELQYRYGGERVTKFIDVLLLFTAFPAKNVRGAASPCLSRPTFSDEGGRILTYRSRHSAGAQR